MANVGELSVQIGAELGGLQKGLSEAAQSVERFSGSLASSAAAFGQAGIALTSFGGILTGFLGLAITEAGKAEAEQLKLAAALKATGASADIRPFLELARSLQSITRFSDEAIISVERILTTFGATADQVRQLTPLILDISTALDRDVAQTAQAVGRGLSGAQGALQRFIGVLPDGISLSEDFASSLAELKKRVDGASQVDSLTNALAKVKNATSDVLEAFGAPFLGPLKSAAAALQGLAETVRNFTEAFPGLTRILVFGTGALAAISLGVGVFLLVLSQAPAAIGLVAAGFDVLQTAIGAIGVFLAANPVVLIIAAIVAAAVGLVIVVRNFDLVKAAIAGLAAFATTAFSQLADGIALVVDGLKHLNFDEVKRGLSTIGEAFREGRKAGIEAYHNALKTLQDDPTPVVPPAHKKSLDEITAAYTEAAQAAELFGLQTQKAAAQQAQGDLSRPGLTEQDFQAIEDARLRTVAAGAQTELQLRIAAREQELRDLDALGVASKEITAKRIEAQKDLQQAQTQLATVSLEVTRKAAQDIVAAEKRAVESRVTLLKTVLDETKTVEHARVEAVQQAADQQLRIQQVLEQTRIGLIQRAVQIQQSLSSAISSAQEALFRAQTSREDAAFRARERARTDAVRQGLLDQTEAQRQSEDDRFALAVRTAQRRIDLEQSQLQQAQALNQLQAGFAVEEARSKIGALEAENAARKAQLQSNFDLRRLDLLNADEINRLELKSTLDRINAENEALARQGGISPQEAAARQRELDNILAGFAQKRSTILQQLDLQQKASASAQVAIDQETAAKRLQVEAELKVQLANLASADVKTRADAAARIAQLEGQLAGDIAEQQEALKARGLTPGDIKKITAPAEAVLNSVKNLGTEQVNIVQGALAQLQSVYESFAKAVSSALQPVVDAVKLLTNPALLQQLLRIPTPALPGGGVGPLPAGGVGGGAGASVVPTQQVTNLTIPLQVNGQPLATAVLRFIDGQLQSFEQSTA